MKNDHGGFSPPVARRVPSNKNKLFTSNKHKLFTSALKDFEQSIKNRTNNILLKDLMQILEKNDADLDRKWSTYFGNKRYLKRPIARVYSALPSPRKRKKLNKQEHSIGDAKQSAGETPAPSRPEYRFIARNTMFPDPRNCTNFTPKARGDSTPCSPHPLSTTMETTTNMLIKTAFIMPSTQISHRGDPNADSHRTAPQASPSAAKLTRAYPSPSNHD